MKNTSCWLYFSFNLYFEKLIKEYIDDIPHPFLVSSFCERETILENQKI